MPVARDPESIGELWQFIEGEFKLLVERIQTNDKIATLAIQALVTSQRSTDARVDINDALLTRFIPSVPEAVKQLEIDVQELKDNQRTFIVAGSVLLAIGSFIWPLIRSWLHLGGS